MEAAEMIRQLRDRLRRKAKYLRVAWRQTAADEQTGFAMLAFTLALCLWWFTL